MGPFESGIGAVAFWLVIGAISIAGTLMPYFKHRETQRTIRAAIDKGQAIDPALLAEPKRKETRPEVFVLRGAVLVAAGLGLEVLAACLGYEARKFEPSPMYGVGAIVLFIGVAYAGYGFWRMKARDRA